MNFNSDLEIRKKISLYLANQISLDEFEDWFVAGSWNFQKGTPALQELVSEVELLLAEFSNSHLSEKSLRNQLLPFVA